MSVFRNLRIKTVIQISLLTIYTITDRNLDRQNHINTGTTGCKPLIESTEPVNNTDLQIPPVSDVCDDVIDNIYTSTENVIPVTLIKCQSVHISKMERICIPVLLYNPVPQSIPVLDDNSAVSGILPVKIKKLPNNRIDVRLGQCSIPDNIYYL